MENPGDTKANIEQTQRQNLGQNANPHSIASEWVLILGNPEDFANPNSLAELVFQKVLPKKTESIAAVATTSSIAVSTASATAVTTAPTSTISAVDTATLPVVKTTLTMPIPNIKDSYEDLLLEALTHIIITRKNNETQEKLDSEDSAIKINFVFNYQGLTKVFDRETFYKLALQPMLYEMFYAIPGSQLFWDEYDSSHYSSDHHMIPSYRIGEMNYRMANAHFDHFIKIRFLSRKSAVYFQTLCGNRLPTEDELTIQEHIQNKKYKEAFTLTQRIFEEVEKETRAKYERTKIKPERWNTSDAAYELGLQLLDPSPVYALWAFNLMDFDNSPYFFVTDTLFVKTVNKVLTNAEPISRIELKKYVSRSVRSLIRLILLQNNTHFLDQNENFILSFISILERYAASQSNHVLDPFFNPDTLVSIFSHLKKSISTQSSIEFMTNNKQNLRKPVYVFFIEVIFQMLDKINTLNTHRIQAQTNISPTITVPDSLKTLASTSNTALNPIALSGKDKDKSEHAFNTLSSIEMQETHGLPKQNQNATATEPKFQKDLPEPPGWTREGNWSDFQTKMDVKISFRKTIEPKDNQNATAKQNPEKDTKTAADKSDQDKNNKVVADNKNLGAIPISIDRIKICHNPIALNLNTESNTHASPDHFVTVLALGFGFDSNLPENSSIEEDWTAFREDINEAYLKFFVGKSEALEYSETDIPSNENLTVYYAYYAVGSMRKEVASKFFAYLIEKNILTIEAADAFKTICGYRTPSVFELETKEKITTLLTKADSMLKTPDLKLCDEAIEHAKTIHAHAKLEFRNHVLLRHAKASDEHLLDDSNALIELGRELLPISRHHAIKAFESLPETALYFSEAQNELSEIYFAWLQIDHISRDESKRICKKLAFCAMFDKEARELFCKAIELYLGFDCIGSDNRFFDSAFVNQFVHRVRSDSLYDNPYCDLIVHLADVIREKRKPTATPITPLLSLAMQQSDQSALSLEEEGNIPAEAINSTASHAHTSTSTANTVTTATTVSSFSLK